MYDLLRKVLRLFFQRPVISGLDLVHASGPCVFAANHQGSYGPIILMLYMPFRMYPWVTHEVMIISKSPDYIRKDFIEPELRIHGPVSYILSWIIGFFAVKIMHTIEAVPVFKKSKKIFTTISKSVDLLLLGKRLLIFPEIPGTDTCLGVHEFDTGFLKLAQRYKSETGKRLPVYPVSVNKETKHIVISAPLFLDHQSPFLMQREEMIENILQSVYHGIRISKVMRGMD